MEVVSLSAFVRAGGIPSPKASQNAEVSLYSSKQSVKSYSFRLRYTVTNMNLIAGRTARSEIQAFYMPLEPDSRQRIPTARAGLNDWKILYMKKWEYTLLVQLWDHDKQCFYWADQELDPRSSQERVAALHQEGWETVSSFPCGDRVRQHNYLLRRAAGVNIN